MNPERSNADTTQNGENKNITLTSINSNSGKDPVTGRFNPKNFNKECDDFLPSFEMHSFMFNRSLNENNLPDYQDIEPVASNDQINSMISNDAELNSGEFVLNNLNKLQKINLPIEVNVTFTKDILKMDEPYEKENPLRTYQPGEIVCGFMTFENKGTMNIPFEMLLVSMECKLGVINPKNGNCHKKTLVTMNDLEASFTFLPDAFYTVPEEYDPNDNVILGFKYRIFEPGVVVKKIFKFRIPNQLLDTTCNEQFPEHLQLPPSFGYYKNNIRSPVPKIDTHLGYGRSDVLGSPINVNDYTPAGVFCSYFIDVQIIGKRLDIYKQFYTPATKHNYEFIFLKKVEHHFRVGKSNEDDVLPLNYGSTKDQLDSIEKTAIEAIEVLTERQMLNQVNITDRRQQDEIIFSSNGKMKITEITTQERDIEKSVLNGVRHCNMYFKFKKDLFSKLGGELNILAEMDKNASVKSFLPKLMEDKTTSILFSEKLMKLSSPTVTLELEYKPSGNSKSFPTTLAINPTIIAIDIESVYGIPFIVDNNYILQDINNIKKNFHKFILYYEKLNDLEKKINCEIPHSTKNLLQGMSSLKYTEIPISSIFKGCTIDIPKGEWKYDVKSQIYRTTTKFQLEFNTDVILACPKALLPSFQTCRCSRLYKLELTISPRKGYVQKTCFPINVI